MKKPGLLIFVLLSMGLYAYKYFHSPINSPINSPTKSPTKGSVSVSIEQISEFKTLRIAHAGGGIASKTYTNSYEALNSNLQKGFLYFELDFSFTKDNGLVCLHDWKHTFKRTFGFDVDEKITLIEFEDLVSEKAEFTNCTLDGLAAWMNENPAAIIVTDVKENNITALKMISSTLPNANKRVIPQIYQPKNFDIIKALGFEQIIWTLYRFSGSADEVLSWTAKFQQPFAITMPKRRVKSILPEELNRRHIPTYVHTINSAEELEKLVTTLLITEIYTDFLPP